MKRIQIPDARPLAAPFQTELAALAKRNGLASFSANRPAYRPEFVPLPRVGGDPVCGKSRSFWYAAERAGLFQLVRVRLPGRVRGRVLLPVPQAIEFINRLAGRHATPDVALASGEGGTS